MKKQFLALAIMLHIFVSCSNDDSKSSGCEDNLPAITTTGANTFGCCINGSLLIPRDGDGTNGGSEKGFKTWGDPSGNNEYVEIDIRDYKSDRTGSLVLHIQGLNQLNTGDYILDESNGYTSIDGLFHNYVHCKVFNETTKSYQYYRSYENSGTLKITRYDFANRIISGTFNCKVKNSTDENDIIEIKDGRFDLNWQTLPNVSFP